MVLIVPAIRYQSKATEELPIVIHDLDGVDGLNWILSNHKQLPVEDGQAGVLFVNDAGQLDHQMMASVNNNVFIGEMLFSQFGGDVSKHNFLEQVFDTHFTGFIGMTISDLGEIKDIPDQIIKTYEAKANSSWNYYGKGIILASEEEVLVLVEGVDYHESLVLESGGQSYPYSGFFEILEDGPYMTDTFEIPVNETGEEKLNQLGLPSSFGAAYKVSNKLYDGIYYTGQFSSIKVEIPSAYDTMAQIMQNKGIYDDKMNESLYWKWYYPKMSALLKDNPHMRYDLKLDTIDGNKFVVHGQQIYYLGQETKEEFFIKGINLGSALPGKTFTEFPQDKATYRTWLEQMAELNVNTVRVYTLLPPTFYQALYDFNENRQNPIYLLQEIWPEEYPEDHNYLGEAYNETYRQEIEYAVHAIHGNINIPVRSYRAYGIYKWDVSPYLIGYLVGREMEPMEVQATDALNENYRFKGQYLYSNHEASPTEGWLAASCDYALKIEDIFYGDSPLVAIVSWPTLDPKSHDSEWSLLTRKENKYNDNTIVDINHIGVHKDRVSGFFGAYHIYPNYPDFMNNEPSYNNYHDEGGIFRYGGYLEEFMSGHSKYPAVVAEYGISTSQVTAHVSPDGYHHGGLSEEDQAEGIIRMTQAIIEEGYSGAIIFEWMDEWAKKTWTTEPYMIPYNKNPFWHNVLDPEQNYGVLAIESLEPKYVKNGPISLGQNAAYVYIKVDADEMDSGGLQLGIDTVDRGEGIDEFLLRLGSTSDLLANPGYNWTRGYYSAVESPFDSYVPLMQVTNSENTSMSGDVVPEHVLNLSHLHYGSFTNPRNSVSYDGKAWTVRLPYGLLGISDPSQNYVLSDTERKIPVLRDEIDVEKIEGIKIKTLGDNQIYEFKLDQWYQPEYKARFKNGFDDISEYFNQLSIKGD
jgi:hypothetical protein